MAVHRGGREWGAEIPVFDGFVPGARAEHGAGAVWDVDKTDAADWLFMGSDLNCGGTVGAEVEHPGCFVGAAADDFGAVLGFMLVKILDMGASGWRTFDQ